MDEKRQHPRYKARILIKYKKLDDPASSWQSGPEIKNISFGGMLFSAYENMPVGTMLIFKLQIFTKDSAIRIIELNAEIVGVEDGIVSYDTRVVFTGLGVQERDFLKQFISYIES
jgi:mannose/fructose/N-acetylgalactosamine-specific phosphotransferase system component IIB